MAKRLYLGNLPYTTTAQDVHEFFAPRKPVTVDLIVDRETGRARGFGFAEFATDEDAQAGLERNGAELGGRAVTVNVANDKPRGGGGGGGGGGGRGGGGRRQGGQRNRRDGGDGHGWHE